VTLRSRAAPLLRSTRASIRRFKSFRYWENAAGSQRILPLRIFEPSTLEELIDIVQSAEHEGVTVRAVGSHHAWSDAALSAGYVIETHGFDRFLEIDDARAESSTENLIRVEAGIKLRAFNEQLLYGHRKALLNMGGYDEQTLGGVVSTSTHGSGVGFGPMCDFVVSIDLVVSEGRCIRIEPTDGLTDPHVFSDKHPTWHLEQNDDWFHSAQVNIGCFGIIYAVTIEVTPWYWLTERREIHNWNELEPKLRDRRMLTEHRHYEVYIDPYPTSGQGDRVCLVTTRDTNEVGPDEGQSLERSQRNALTEFGLTIPLVRRIIVFLFATWPNWGPKLLARGLRNQARKDFTSHSFRVLNVGSANLLRVVCSEIAVPVDDSGTHIEAVHRLFRIAELWRSQGRIYHAGYISLRFVRESPAFLSMMYGRPLTMMIELFILHPIRGNEELLSAYEDALADLGGRPHWGQFNRISGGHQALVAMYPRFPEWQKINRQLNATGVFDSPMTKRIGLTRRGAAPEDVGDDAAL